MDNKINHLQMIQGVISRMTSNSFSLKGWAVTLVAGIFALASKDADKMYFIVAYIPIVVFLGPGCILSIARAAISGTLQ